MRYSPTDRPSLRTNSLLTLAVLSSLALYNTAVYGFPFSDSFSDKTGSGGTSYAVGDDLANQKPNGSDIWNAVTPPGAPNIRPVIVSGNLSSTNLPQSFGNSVSFAPAATASNGGKGVRLNYNNPIIVSTTRAYYSFLLKLTDLSTVTTGADTNYFCGFSGSGNAQSASVARVAARLVTRKVGTDGTNYVLGMSRNNVPADSVYDTNIFNLNDTVFVVGEYDRIGGTTNVSLWINPPASSYGAASAPAPNVTVATVSSFGGDINGSENAVGFVLLCQNVTAPSGVVDEVRIGTDWSFVTGGDPAVTQNPTNRLVVAGGTANFTVAARGTPTLGYQWYKDGSPLNDGLNLSGTHTPTLTVSSVSAGDAGGYSVFVTNGLGAFVQSATATLSLLTDPLITVQPQPVTTNFGGTAVFQVTATGTSPIGYQWHKQGFGDVSDGPNVTGSHSSTLTLTGVAAADAGNYYVTVSNNIAQVDSDAAALTVLDPYIVSDPVSVTTNAGATVSFHAVAAGSGGLSYQWLKDGNIIFGGGNLSGINSDTLTISPVSASDQAGYSLAVFGSGSITSAVANLTILSPVSIAIQPSPRTVLTGTRAVFAVGAGGTGPYNYQWQREGTNIPGATSSAYVITNAQAALVGNYSVVVTNSFSSVTSSVVALGVADNLWLGETNLVVVRIGDGAQPIDNVNGNSMYIDQYAADGTYINTISIPDDGPNAMTAIGRDNINGVQSGSTTGTVLTRSLDGRYIVVAGYNTNLNYGASLATSSATNVPRGIALIDSFGQYTLAVKSTNSSFDANPNFWRAGITDGTNNFWGSGNVYGTYYFGFDAPGSLVQNTMPNMRSMALFNGDIYCIGAGSPNGVLKLSGMPTTNSSPVPFLFSGSSGFFDLCVSPNGSTIYVTDQRSTGNGGGVQRWDFDGSNWVLSYTLTSGSIAVGPRYVIADFSGPNNIIYVTSNDQTFDNDRIVKIVDTGAGSAGTTLAYAGVNQTFRSIRFGPVPNFVVPRPLLSSTRSGNSLILNWSGSYTLQSATNVTGPYSDVSGATNPYTNNLSGSQGFFRLRQ